MSIWYIGFAIIFFLALVGVGYEIWEETKRPIKFSWWAILDIILAAAFIISMVLLIVAYR